MRLIKTVYFKVNENNTDYFLKEKSYINGHDGWINIDFITEETFLRNLEKGGRIEFISFEDAPMAIKRAIVSRYKNAVS